MLRLNNNTVFHTPINRFQKNIINNPKVIILSSCIFSHFHYMHYFNFKSNFSDFFLPIRTTYATPLANLIWKKNKIDKNDYDKTYLDLTTHNAQIEVTCCLHSTI